MHQKLNRRFRDLEGGLFSNVSKADVGDAAAKLVAAGGQQMGWADPFMPDASMPQSVMQAMEAALRTGTASHYEPPIGNLLLREALAKKVGAVNGISADPQRNIIVTPGSDSGLFFAMMPFLDEGDEVIIPDPSYPSNQNNARLLGAVPVPMPLAAERGYQFSRSDLDACLTDRTRMVLISHPNNPTTTVFDRRSLEDLAQFCVDNDLILVSDQAFEDHVFGDREMITPAALPGMWKRTVSTFSLSKGYGLSGLRVGYLLADDWIMDKFYAAAVSVLGTTNTLAQQGALAALGDPSILPGYRERLRARAESFYRTMKDVPGVKLRKPESGILGWLDVRELGGDREVAEHLAQEEGILVNEGRYYGDEGIGHIRIVFGVLDDEDAALVLYQKIADALTRLHAQL